MNVHGYSINTYQKNMPFFIQKTASDCSISKKPIIHNFVQGPYAPAPLPASHLRNRMQRVPGSSEDQREPASQRLFILVPISEPKRNRISSFHNTLNTAHHTISIYRFHIVII